MHVRAPGVDGELLEYLAALRPAMRHGRGRGHSNPNPSPNPNPRPNANANPNPNPNQVEGEASLELLADGKLLHTFAGPASAWPKQPLMVPSAAIALRFRANRAPTGRKARA